MVIYAELHSYTSNCFQMKTEMQEINFIKQKQILTNFMQFIELFHFVFGFSFSIRNAWTIINIQDSSFTFSVNTFSSEAGRW